MSIYNYCKYCFSFLIILCIVNVASAQYGYDTATVYFEIGKSKLEKNSIQTLDSLSDYLKENKNRILIYGYADYLGAEKLSDRLSENRAKKVEQFLLKNKVPQSQIYQTTGVGQITIRGEESHGNQTYRRVDVFVKRTASNEESEGNANLFSKEAIKEIKQDETLILDNINFRPGTAIFLPITQAPLKELLNTMNENPTLKIKLEGHVCCPNDMANQVQEGTTDFNQSLSEQRAKKVYDYLLANGIDKSRLKYEGYSNKKLLINPELSESDRIKNRRVEVRIISK